MCLYGEPNWFGDKWLTFSVGEKVGLLPNKAAGAEVSIKTLGRDGAFWGEGFRTEAPLAC